MRNKAPMPVPALHNISAKSRMSHLSVATTKRTVQYGTGRELHTPGPRLGWSLEAAHCPAQVAEPAARQHIFNLIKIKFEINIQIIYLLHEYPEQSRCPRSRPSPSGLPALARRHAPGRRAVPLAGAPVLKKAHNKKDLRLFCPRTEPDSRHGRFILHARVSCKIKHTCLFQLGLFLQCVENSCRRRAHVHISSKNWWMPSHTKCKFDAVDLIYLLKIVDVEEHIYI